MMRMLCVALGAVMGFSMNAAEAGGVLVFGATGQLGAPHVRMLLERDEQVTVFHRPTSSFQRLEGLDYARAEAAQIARVLREDAQFTHVFQLMHVKFCLSYLIK